MCDEIMNFTEEDLRFNVHEDKTGQKENHGIRTSGIEDSQRNITTDSRQVIKIWENYITKCAIERIDQKTWKSNPKRK